MKNLWVLKVGGALLQEHKSKLAFMETIAKGIDAGHKFILVHGGGCLVDEQLLANKMHTTKINGLRVTPIEQVPIIVGALAGTANKQLQACAIHAKISSIGLSLLDANMVKAKIMRPELGYVGMVESLDPSILNLLLENGLTPIISSIAVDEDGNLLNVNADDAAMAIAKLLQAKLVLLSDVDGVLDKEGKLIKALDAKSLEELIKTNVIGAGMQVKVSAALSVAKALGSIVQIGSWRNVTPEIWNNPKDFGTQIKC